MKQLKDPAFSDLMRDMSREWKGSQINDDEVLRLITEGDGSEQRHALKIFYWRWATPMKHFFLNRGCHPMDCEDLLQEVVIKIWKGASGFRRKGQASSWIWTIIRNTLNDHYRRSPRHPAELPFDPDNDLHDRAGNPPYDQDHDDCIERGLQRFAITFPDRAHALEMWSTGMDLQLIASHIGRGYGATRQFLLECRKKMRPFLEPCFDSSSNA